MDKKHRSGGVPVITSQNAAQLNQVVTDISRDWPPRESTNPMQVNDIFKKPEN